MENNNHNEDHILNPFSPQHPAQPEYFSGRKAELEYFRKTALNSAKLNPPAPLNYAILGTWGLGKTSLIYELRRIALEELQKKIRCTSIHFSMSPQSCRDWESFSTSFLTTVKSTVNASHQIRSKIMREIGKWEVNFNIGLLGAQRKADKEPPDLLGVLKGLWHDHLKPAGTEIAFILLDDLHYFPIREEESAYLTLRATFQELVNQKCNYSLIVTAHSGLFTEIAELAEPVLRFFRRFDLKPFSFEEAQEAIIKRLLTARGKTVVHDEVIKSVVEKTGGHPYLIMFTMYEMLAILGKTTKIGIREFDKTWPQVEELLATTIFTQKFQSASEKEKELMVKIARSETRLVSPSEFGNVKGTNELFSRLERKELLLRRSRGKYSLFHPLFVNYLRKQ